MTAQFPLPLPYREAMGADDFMVAGSNQEAVAWLDKWPAWGPSHCLILYGPGGSGKTHLSHVWQSRSHGKRLGLDELKTQSAGNIAAGNSAILVDDADKAMGDIAAEEALFHLYNLLGETKGSLLLTGQKPVSLWGIGLADLRSRLLSVPVTAITAPDDALLSALLVKQFRDRQIDIGMDVVEYLLPRVTRSPAAIRQMVASLDRSSLAQGKAVTIPLVRKFLEEENRFTA